jgi:hypothetical protein
MVNFDNFSGFGNQNTSSSDFSKQMSSVIIIPKSHPSRQRSFERLIFTFMSKVPEHLLVKSAAEAQSFKVIP